MTAKVKGVQAQQYNKQNVEKLVKYANGSELNPTEIGPTDGLTFMAGAELTMQGSQWWKNNKGHRVQSLKQNLTPNLTKTKNFVIDFKKNPGGTIMNGYREHQVKSMLKTTPKAPVIAEGAAITPKLHNAQVVADKYQNVRTLLEEAQTLKGDALKTATKNIEAAEALAKYNIHQAKMSGEIKPTSKIGQAKRFVAKKTGISALKGKYLKAATTSSKLRTLSKYAKGGNALFAAVSAGVAGLEVYGTYQALGKESGNRQLVKSTINTAADVGGWIIGAKAGAVAGAAIGSCIPIPVVGTVVGAIVGVGCGLLGSWLAGKAARAVTGPSELELAEQKQAEIAMNNPEAMGNLLEAATIRCAEEVESGVISADTEAIADVYDDVYATYTEQNLDLMAEADASAQAPESETETATQSQSSEEETVTETSEETSSSQSTTLLADASTNGSTTEETEEETKESESKSEDKVKNKELAKILTNLSSLIGYGTSSTTTSTYAFNPTYAPSFNMGFTPTMPMYGMGFNPMMNNFNFFPQFGYMA